MTRLRNLSWWRLDPKNWKPFRERNLFLTGMVGLVAVIAVVGVSLEYDKLPFFSDTVDHSAYFAELGGLKNRDPVEVAGKQVGVVTGITLDGNRVRVDFTLEKTIALGDSTAAAIKTQTALGSKFLQVTPRGDGILRGSIPVGRTTSPYELPDALGDLTNTISGLDTTQLSESLTTLSQTFENTPDDLRVAVNGLARISDTVNSRDADLRSLLGNADKVSAILSNRSTQIASLVVDVNTLLVQLQARSDDIDDLMTNIAAVSQQLSGFAAENRGQIGPALDQLNGVLAILDKRKKAITLSIQRINAYAGALGESVGSGPFFKAYVANLLPGQYLQPFIDAAFRKQGLDPQRLLDDFLPPQYLPNSRQDYSLNNKPDPRKPLQGAN